MKITVITVCYNSVKTLEKTIQSVISRKYNDLEYIIIDGGSTDGTLNIIEKYKKNISLCISEPDNGIYDAMNKGIAYASGDVVAFLNSDDWYASDINVFQKVEEYFSNSKADIVSGNIYVCSRGVCSKVLRNRMTEDNIFFDIVCPHPAMFVKKELYSKLGVFDTSYKIAADTKWIIGAYISGVNILCVDDYFTCFREGGISSTKPYATMKEQYAVALDCARRKHLTELEKKINNYYIAELETMRSKRRWEVVMEEKPEEVKKLFDYHKRYYIWGTGIRGRRCLNIFERFSVPIEGFIDSDPRQISLGVYNVIRPEEMDKESCICVTPKDFEEELCVRLKNMGVEEKRFFTYSEMIKNIEAISFSDEIYPTGI